MKKSFIWKLLTAKCEKLPKVLTTMYVRFLLALSILSFGIQLLLIILQASNFKNYVYGPYYRIVESASFLVLWLMAWIIDKRSARYSHIFSGILGYLTFIAFFEVIIQYNEAEEGFLYFYVFMVTSFMQIDFLKYYFIMILQYLILTAYVNVRIMVTKPHSKLLSSYDCVFYGLTSTLIMTAFYYIFTTAFNIIYEEKDKAVNILQSWRQMMSISPIGTIIITNSTILFINDVAASILKSNSVKIESNSIIYFITETEKLSENETNRTIKTPNQHYIYCDLKSIVFEEKNASIIILNDITKVINWQNQKHEQEMVEMLVATSTHEMRTPLHCIKNTLQMLQDERPQPNEFISRAITACDMQECYINDMLDFAKFKKDSLVIVKEHICVNELLNEVGGYFTYTAKENNIYLNVEMPTDSIIISADYTRLKQVLFNLISNAFKFTQSGGITLVASFIKSKVIIEVKDTGVGMRPEDLKHLFEAFGVIESTRKYNKSGTGLGLFLCKQLCALMGAGISVESKIDIGSTFSLEFDQLPLNTHSSPKLKASSSMNSHSTNKLTKIHAKGRALVVDDNGFNCRILEKMLELQSVASYRALNGQFALDLLHSKGDIAIAFVDLNMPIMDGFELMKIIKNTHSMKDKFPIYALTGDATDETKKKCETYGFNGCLLKPFTKDKLKELLIQNSIL